MNVVGNFSIVADARYAELHCLTNFSFLRGASHPDELVDQAAALNLTALAITDRHSLAGVVRAHGAAKRIGLKLLIGAEIHPIDAPSLVLWATDRPAYGRLCQLLTLGNLRVKKGDCRLHFNDLADHAEGLIAGVLLGPLVDDLSTPTPPPFQPDSRKPSNASPSAIRPPGVAPFIAPEARARFDWLSRYRELFGNRCYALAELHHGPDDHRRLLQMAAIAKKARVPMTASNNVHYHVAARRLLHDVLTAVRLRTTVAAAVGHLFPNAERRLLSAATMAERFALFPEALERTIEVADRCRFSLDELRYEYPEELTPPGVTPAQYLAELVRIGAVERYPDGVPEKVQRLIDHELAIVAELRYEAYFITVWDLVRFARSRDILCQGRGSAANSAICYCLGVTAVNPDRVDVLFERFISVERREAPDIDIDFEHERREEVIQYLYTKYGRERAGLTAEVISYRPRSAIRDVGKALGLSLDRVDRLAKTLHQWGGGEPLGERCKEAGLDPDSPVGQRLLYLMGEIVGFPRHLSQHVGGMVLTQSPLCETTPIENAAMPNRTVIQWNKDDLDELGILKVDCLGLGMLTAIRKCFDLIAGSTGERFTLANTPQEDPVVYQMIQQADTVGVFQIESRAQMSMLPRLKPACYYDLVIEVAIVRPGPIQGNMVHPYLRRRQGLEEVSYPTPALKEVLHKTLGVPLFQEQAMKLAVVAAGFTPGEADQLRRAMAAWRRPGLIEQFRQKLLTGMLANGLPLDFAERVFGQIRGFGEYGFPESHAASFALLVYVSAWLKCHYPAAFAGALINSQPMGFYAPAQLVADARRHGVEVRPADVNSSHLDCTLEPIDLPDGEASQAKRFALRLGFRQVRGLPEAAAEAIVAARAAGPFRTLLEVARRAGLNRAALLLVARADVFHSIGLNRREALWQAASWKPQVERQLLLFTDVDPVEPIVRLPAQPPLDSVLADYNSVGLSLKDHPMAFLRRRLNDQGVASAEQIKTIRNGRRTRVAGLVLVRQQPGTAKGIRFMTLEDETGTVNLVVRPEIYKRDRAPARSSPVVLAEGLLQNVDGVIHILAERLEDVSDQLFGLRGQSRDFH